jgi:holo-[acyl-carrier protein] synthase
MHIVGVGTEIVECVRVGRMIERHGELFLTRVYTAREIQHCRGKKHVTENFAGSWAAKRAILRSLAAGGRQGLAWTDIEVRTLPEGSLKVYLCGLAKERALALEIGDIALSIAHCRAYATATAIALGK